MTKWKQDDLHQHMQVYSSDGEQVGHVAEVYVDSFLIHKGHFLPANRYIPYSAIAEVGEDRVQLTLAANEVEDTQWEKRPAYEKHLYDPTQLFYDEGHGVANPFDPSDSQ